VPHCQIFFNQLQGKTLKILKEKKEHYKCVDGTVLNYCDTIFYVKQVGMVFKKQKDQHNRVQENNQQLYKEQM
jgi:hypothetical protein